MQEFTIKIKNFTKGLYPIELQRSTGMLEECLNMVPTGGDKLVSARKIIFPPFSDTSKPVIPELTVRDDQYFIYANEIASGNVLHNDYFSGFDTILILSVNNSTDLVGQWANHSQGGRFKLNVDGSFTYDPNGAFDFMTASYEDLVINYSAQADQETASGEIHVRVSKVTEVPITPDPEEPYNPWEPDPGEEPGGSFYVYLYYEIINFEEGSNSWNYLEFSSDSAIIHPYRIEVNVIPSTPKIVSWLIGNDRDPDIITWDASLPWISIDLEALSLPEGVFSAEAEMRFSFLSPNFYPRELAFTIVVEKNFPITNFTATANSITEGESIKVVVTLNKVQEVPITFDVSYITDLVDGTDYCDNDDPTQLAPKTFTIPVGETTGNLWIKTNENSFTYAKEFSIVLTPGQEWIRPRGNTRVNVIVRKIDHRKLISFSGEVEDYLCTITASVEEPALMDIPIDIIGSYFKDAERTQEIYEEASNYVLLEGNNLVIKQGETSGSIRIVFKEPSGPSIYGTIYVFAPYDHPSLVEYRLSSDYTFFECPTRNFLETNAMLQCSHAGTVVRGETLTFTISLNVEPSEVNVNLPFTISNWGSAREDLDVGKFGGFYLFPKNTNTMTLEIPTMVNEASTDDFAYVMIWLVSGYASKLSSPYYLYDTFRLFGPGVLINKNSEGTAIPEKLIEVKVVEGQIVETGGRTFTKTDNITVTDDGYIKNASGTSFADGIIFPGFQAGLFPCMFVEFTFETIVSMSSFTNYDSVILTKFGMSPTFEFQFDLRNNTIVPSAGYLDASTESLAWESANGGNVPLPSGFFHISFSCDGVYVYTHVNGTFLGKGKIGTMDPSIRIYGIPYIDDEFNSERTNEVFNRFSCDYEYLSKGFRIHRVCLYTDSNFTPPTEF